MIHHLSQKLTDKLVSHGVVQNDERDIYEYGFELVVSGILGFIIVATVGIVFKIFIPSLIFYFIFVIVRTFSGGYHATSYLTCKITFIAVYIGVMFFSVLFYQNYHLIYHILLIAIYIISILQYAPVENKNKPLDNYERMKNRRISIILAVIISTVSFITAYFSIKYAMVIAMSLLSVAMLMIIGNLKKEEE